MNERSMQFRVGVMILATILVGFILVAIFIGSNPLLQSTYPIYIRFNEAPGVASGTPVRMAGIRIGQVRNVRLAEDDSGVIVTVDIESNRHVSSDQQCKVVAPALMGDTSLEFVRIPNFHGEKVEVKPGEILQGQTASDMTGSIAGLQRQAAQTLDTLTTAGRDIDRLATRVDRLVETNEERITHMIGEADETMQLLQKALIASNDILGDPKLREQIKLTIAEMPVVLKETRGAVEQIGGTFASLQRNMQNIEGLTKPLGERGPGLVDEFDTSIRKLNLLSDNMLRFSQELNDPQGSLGALLHDKELYQHVNHVAKNLDELTRDLKPILYDARTFTDKIARHPELLGVRGAIKKDAGLKDTPGGDGTENGPPNSRWPIGGSGQWGIGR